MTVVPRSVEIEEKSVDIVERFVGFLPVEDSTGAGLTDAFLNKINELGILLADCRGQGYDNGANMRACNKGVQAQILQMN